MSRKPRDLDEDDVRVRPGPGSRPRSRLRPTHAEATEGFVVAVDRGRFTCLVGKHEVVAVRARELGRKAVVVGDQVGLVGDVSGRADTLARLVRVEPRTSPIIAIASASVHPVIASATGFMKVMCSSASVEMTPSPIDSSVTRRRSFSAASSDSTALSRVISVSVPMVRVGLPPASHSTGLPRLRIHIQWPSRWRSRYSIVS